MLFPKLSQITTKNVIFVNPEETLFEALEKMIDSNHSRIILHSDDKYYQITAHDIIHLKSNNTDFNTKVVDIHLDTIPSLSKDANILDTLDLVKNNFEIICVLDTDGSLFGVATASDILASIDPHIILENTVIGDVFKDKKNFTTISKELSLDIVMTKLDDSTNDCVLIVDDKQQVEGIITSKDINKAILSNADFSGIAQDLMISPVRTLPNTCAVNDAISFIQNEDFHRVVVVDEKTNKLIGLITQQDLISQSYVSWSRIVKEHFSEMEEIVNIFKNRNQQLSLLASTDTLTGIYNRRMFEDLFDQNLSFQIRHNINSSLGMIDIDDFKSINDTYGHDVGDEVIKAVVKSVKEILRTSDVLARWGGEEFIILLKHVNVDDSFMVCEKVRKSIENITSDILDKNITVSLGLTEIKNEDTIQSAVKRADLALYEAKESGKNKTILK